MEQIIEVEPFEAGKWLKQNPDWEFRGEVNHISHLNVSEFVSDLYDAGCKSIEIYEYEWTLEPVYEGDEFRPDILILFMPDDMQKRQEVLSIVNNRFTKLSAKHFYKDTKHERLLYFFEPKPHEIAVGAKKITWYT